MLQCSINENFIPDFDTQNNNNYMSVTWQPCRPFPNHARVCYLILPGCINPDYVQVAEVVALQVHSVAAGTALGPHPVRRRAVSNLHLLLSCHWKSQTWWETQRRSVTETKTFPPSSPEKAIQPWVTLSFPSNCFSKHKTQGAIT